MKKLTLAALLLASVSLAQASGSASTTMEVSFVIRAACSVQTEANGAPRVECSKGTGYQLVGQSAPESKDTPPDRQPSSATQAGDTWQVIF